MVISARIVREKKMHLLIIIFVNLKTKVTQMGAEIPGIPLDILAVVITILQWVVILEVLACTSFLFST